MAFEPTTQRPSRSFGRKITAVLLMASALVMTFGSPATAASQGFIADDIGVGYFYGTFGEDPNLVLLTGGDFADFCTAGPGSGGPGTAPARLFPRDDGSLDIKANFKAQPIYLYEVDAPGAPEWLGATCPAFFSGAPAPQAIASGTANLKVRTTVVSESRVEVFNSINGKATANDGTAYTVRASADLVVENGIPVGNPADFVTLDVKRIGS